MIGIIGIIVKSIISEPALLIVPVALFVLWCIFTVIDDHAMARAKLRNREAA